LKPLSDIFRLLRIPFAALFLFLIVSCILDGRQAGRGSEVENELGVYGVLVDELGTPVAGAKVKALTASPGVGKRSAAGPDSVLTDAKGKYRFAKLAVGEYDLLGDFQAGKLVVLIPRIGVSDPAKPHNVGKDTLRASGGIRAHLLRAGRGAAGVLCFVPGTSFLAISDDSGSCLIDRLPRGRYTVRYSLSGFAIASDSGVGVSSGLITDLPAKSLVLDTALPPPPPASLEAAYDTLREEVRLRWSSVDVADLQGYVVYRKGPGDLSPRELPGGFTADTAFVDRDLGSIDSGKVLELAYFLRSRDRNTNLSLSFSPTAPVRAVSARLAATVLGWKDAPGTQDSLLLGDSLKFILAFSNPTRIQRRIEWRLGDPASEPIRIAQPGVLSGSDTLAWKPEAVGEWEWRVMVIDAAGTVWTASRKVSVLPLSANRPIASATLLSPEIFTSGPIPVSARGSRDPIGRIVKYEYAWGDSAFAEMPGGGPDMTLTAPETPADTVRLRIRVTDDDGLADTASLAFPVRSGTRWENLNADFPAVDYSSVVVFQGKLWAFAQGAAPGAWNSADGKTWNPVPALGGFWGDAWGAVVHEGRIWLFGQSSGDGALVSTDGVEPWRAEALPKELLRRNFFTVAEFKGRMWMFGGDDSSGAYADAWSSADGKSWKLESGAIASGTRTTSRVAVWKDKLWMYGGLRSRNGLGLKFLNDLWSSADGVTWTLEADQALPAERWVSALIAFQDGLWIIAGVDATGREHNDIWRTSDGKEWRQAPGTTTFSPRRTRSAAVFGDKLHLIGGWNVSSYNLGEVWRSP
jgi:hypothetical protein